MDETYGIEIRRAESHEGTDCALCQPEFDGKTAKPSPCYAPTAPWRVLQEVAPASTASGQA